jgi:hypothetical protein
MTGRKTLAEVRAELEAALGAGPAGGGEIAESLRRFLAAGVASPKLAPPRTSATGGADSPPEARGSASRSAELGR